MAIPIINIEQEDRRNEAASRLHLAKVMSEDYGEKKVRLLANLSGPLAEVIDFRLKGRISEDSFLVKLSELAVSTGMNSLSAGMIAFLHHNIRRGLDPFSCFDFNQASIMPRRLHDAVFLSITLPKKSKINTEKLEEIL